MGRSDRRMGVVQALIAVVGVLALAACTPAPEGAGDRGELPEREGYLVPSLQVSVGADSVRLVLHVTNAGSRVETLEYATAQRYDFAVYTAAGAEVWRWSADRGFAQVLGTEEVDPGETRRYEESWAHGGRSGEYVAEGRLVAMNRDIVQRTTFGVP